MLTLAGRTALVTGGSRGIGRAVCVLFGRLGARVAVAYARDERAAREVVAAVEAAGSAAVALRADLARDGEAERLFARAEKALGPLDVLVANHGIWKRAPIDTMTPDEWDETVRDQPRARCARSARRRPAGWPRAARGRSSSSPRPPGSAASPSTPTTPPPREASSRSRGRSAPSSARGGSGSTAWPRAGSMTDMSRDAIESAAGPAILKAIPLGRPGTPEEIAGPIAFLASDLAGYLYGQVLQVNGGAVMVG